jgi:hypothetical protein
MELRTNNLYLFPEISFTSLDDCSYSSHFLSQSHSSAEELRIASTSAYPSMTTKVDVLPPASTPKCAKLLKACTDFDLQKEGSRELNAAAAFLKCEAKEKKPRCAAALKALDACHAGVLGTGTYQGSSHCSLDFMRLLACVGTATAAGTPPP